VLVSAQLIRKRQEAPLRIEEPRGLAEEQAALRRVATLVAAGAGPEEVFAAVAEEVGYLLPVDSASMCRYEPGDALTFVAQWGSMAAQFPVGSRWEVGGHNLGTLVFETARPARVDSYSDDSSGPIGAGVREKRIRSAVATPIIVEGRLWGLIAAGSLLEQPLPSDTEARLVSFTELVAMAVANTDGRAALARLAQEQAALRRVATLVARATPPQEVFAAVAEEVGWLLALDFAILVRYDPQDMLEVVGTWTRTGAAAPTPVGGRLPLGGRNVTTLVYQTGQPARIDYSDVSGVIGQVASRGWGLRSSVGVPVSAESRLWGCMVVAFGGQELQPLPADTEARLFLVDVANLYRYEPDGTATVVASAGGLFTVGSRLKLEGKNSTTLVYQTGRSARMDSYDDTSGPLGNDARKRGIRSSVGTPLMVEGRLWGMLGVGTTTEQPLPPDAEARLASFAELVATAIANAESRSELAASRRRIVAASDQARQRIERDLHDGTQQRLVSLGLAARAAEANVPDDRGDLRAELSSIAAGLADAVAELQEVSRGIHPAVLSERGLGPALRTLARRSAVPVELDVMTGSRFPEPVEVAAYYVASEALANAMKHARPSHVEISLTARDGGLLLSIRDDGIGGADPARGSGLVGLTDRVEALGGSIHVHSPAGVGTHITVDLPQEYELPQGAG
jgi:signal transduction histidine kinase